MYVTNHNLRLPDSTRLKSSQCRASLKRKDDACPMGVNQRTLCAKNEKRSISGLRYLLLRSCGTVSPGYAKCHTGTRLYNYLSYTHRCNMSMTNDAARTLWGRLHPLRLACARMRDGLRPRVRAISTRRHLSRDDSDRALELRRPGAQLRPSRPWQGSAAPRASIAQRGGARSHRR